jgi:hypothetical protein
MIAAVSRTIFSCSLMSFALAKRVERLLKRTSDVHYSIEQYSARHCKEQSNNLKKLKILRLGNEL